MMKMIVFEVQGHFAHFRKFYSNSTSLSYEFPPRTVVSGLIAGILGINRDSYYETFSEDQAFIAVQIVHPTKRISQTVNYLWVKSPKDLDGSSGHMQIPVEWVVHRDGIGHEGLCYRVYFLHQDQSINEALIELLADGKAHYPTFLGITEALASVSYLGCFDAEACEDIAYPLEIASVCPIHLLEDITYPVLGAQTRKYMRDRIPCSFDAKRKISGITQMIYEPSGQEIVAKPKGKIIKVHLSDRTANVLPMRSEMKGGGDDVFLSS